MFLFYHYIYNFCQQNSNSRESRWGTKDLKLGGSQSSMGLEKEGFFTWTLIVPAPPQPRPSSVLNFLEVVDRCVKAECLLGLGGFVMS